MWLDGLGGGPENARRIGREMLRQFEELPPKLGSIDAERLFTVTQIGVHHLEQMWLTIEARLQQVSDARTTGGAETSRAE